MGVFCCTCRLESELEDPDGGITSGGRGGLRFIFVTSGRMIGSFCVVFEVGLGRMVGEKGNTFSSKRT